MICAHQSDKVVTLKAEVHTVGPIKVVAPMLYCTDCGAVGHVRRDTVLMCGGEVTLDSVLPHVEWQFPGPGVVAA